MFLINFECTTVLLKRNWKQYFLQYNFFFFGPGKGWGGGTNKVYYGKSGSGK